MERFAPGHYPTHALPSRSTSNNRQALGEFKTTTTKISTSLASRTKRVAAKSIALIPAESVPFLGVAVQIADTGYELYAACETMRDLDELYLELDVQEKASGDAIHSVCNPELPDAGEIWDGVVAKSGEWLDQARGDM